jgi:DNA-binding SARP family transcriptional activator/class 3 adenylate cyclase/tetratricopeptide (TPR) repeat protein
VANLRKVLEPARAKRTAGEILRTRPPGYLIQVGPDELDLARFERLATQGRAALATDPAHAVRLLRQALELWRGPALADIALTASGQGEMVRLEERRLVAMEDRIEAEFALGRHRALTGELEALVAAHPMRERLHGQLMLALYRSGRQAEALEVYRRTRETLAEELGIDPSRPLQELERAVLVQDPALDLVPTGGPAQAPTTPTPVGPAIAPIHRLQAPAPSVQPAAPEWEPAEERKVVTVLCCDVAGHPVGLDPVDPEDIRARLRLLDDHLRREVERFGGAVEGSVGDAVLAVFGAPVVHEDDPERAVRAGLRILEAIEGLNRTDPDLDLPVRVGISTGEAVVILHARADRGERAVTGGVVNTAVRLCALAPISGVVVDEVTWRTTRHPITYEAVEPPLQGEAKQIPIWRATSARSRHGADLERPVTTPFVGRDEELSLLQGLYRRAVREGSVQLVTVTGEPGVGKSRLVRELAAFVDDQSELVTWRQGRCLPYGEGITFWALGEILKGHAGILESDDPAQAAAKLADSVAAVVEDAAEREWLKQRLAPLVGLTSTNRAGAADREEAFAAWRRFLMAVAHERPLVLVLEDLHWADSALLAFLRHLVEWASHVPLVVVAIARPELYDRAPDWGGGLRNATTIALAPLSDAECARLVAALVDQAVLPAEVQAALLERAGGNPLYAEEICRMLADQGVLRRHGRMVQLSPGAATAFPDSIQALIAARLDALTPDRKALLQDAAVVGKVFWAGALCALGNLDPASVQAGLHELARRELIRPARSSSVKGEAEYAFWHVLTRDVAYGQLPRAARARKHAAAAAWIEQLAGERIADHAEILAHHYDTALKLALAAGAGEEAASLKASVRRFMALAGDRAMGLDIAQADTYYQRALTLYPPGDPERAQVLAKAAEAAFQAGRLAEADRLYEQASDAYRAADDLFGAGSAEVRRLYVLWWRGKTTLARAALGAVELLERQPPGPALATAYQAMAADNLFMGRPTAAVEWADKAIALAGQVGADEAQQLALQMRGVARFDLGDLDGRDDLRAALELGLRLGLGRVTAVAYDNLGEQLLLVEGPEAAWGCYQEGLSLCRQRGMAGMTMGLQTSMLECLFHLGDWDELVTVSDHVLAWYEAQGGGYGTIYAASRKARAQVLRGELAAAAALAEDFLPRAREVGELQVLVVAFPVAALIAQARGDPAAAIRLVEELDEATKDRPARFRALPLPDLARICAATGHLPLAQQLLKGVEAQAAHIQHSLATARAVLTEARGDLQAAAGLYADAAGQWTDYGSVPERGQALLGLGRCLVQLSRRQGRNRLVEARAVFARLGARPLLAETDGWLRRGIAHG